MKTVHQQFNEVFSGNPNQHDLELIAQAKADVKEGRPPQSKNEVYVETYNDEKREKAIVEKMVANSHKLIEGAS